MDSDNYTVQMCTTTTRLNLSPRVELHWSVKDIQTLCDLAKISTDTLPAKAKHAELFLARDSFGNNWTILYQLKEGESDGALYLKVFRPEEALKFGINDGAIMLQSYIHLFKDSTENSGCSVLCYHSDVIHLKPGGYETWFIGTVPDLIKTFKGKELKLVVHVEETYSVMKKAIKTANKEDNAAQEQGREAKAQLGEDIGSMIKQVQVETPNFVVVYNKTDSETRKFYLHKPILMARSSFIKELLLSKVSDADVSKKLIGNFTEAALEVAFEYIYSGEVSVTDTAALPELISLSEMWKLPGLKELLTRIIG